MKIALVSDLHADYWYHNWTNTGDVFSEPPRVDAVIEACNRSDADVIFNAGDTAEKASERKVIRDMMKKPYFEALGNHDFYGSAVGDPQIEVYNLGDRKLMVCTLWTNFWNSPIAAWAAKCNVADFTWIEGITSDRMSQMHEETLYRIETERPNIILSHFAPSLGSIHPRLQGGSLNPYFANNVKLPLEVWDNIELWCHGHTHTGFDYMVGTTRVVCNPCGYRNEHYARFEDYPLKVIEL